MGYTKFFCQLGCLGISITLSILAMIDLFISVLYGFGLLMYFTMTLRDIKNYWYFFSICIATFWFNIVAAACVFFSIRKVRYSAFAYQVLVFAGVNLTFSLSFFYILTQDISTFSFWSVLVLGYQSFIPFGLATIATACHLFIPPPPTKKGQENKQETKYLESEDEITELDRRASSALKLPPTPRTPGSPRSTMSTTPGSRLGRKESYKI